MIPTPKLVKAEKQKQDPNETAKKYPVSSNPIVQLIGQRITVVMRDRSRMTGSLESYKCGLLRLTEASIMGDKDGVFDGCSRDWTLVDRTMLLAIYPE